MVAFQYCSAYIASKSLWVLSGFKTLSVCLSKWSKCVNDCTPRMKQNQVPAAKWFTKQINVASLVLKNTKLFNIVFNLSAAVTRKHPQY